MDNPKINGLDWKIGCENVHNNKDLFLDILRTYCEESQEILKRYGEFQGEDMERTVVDMHGMKSASAGIGALDLSAKFKQMELEGKAGNEDYLLKHMPECLGDLKLLTEELKAFLDTIEVEEVKLDGLPEESLPSEELDGMIEALEEIEFDIFEEKMAFLQTKNFGEAVNNGLAKADRAYENFDYDDAKEALIEVKGLL